MPFDLSILAIVFALLLLIVFFSAIVLYLSFRVKETFRKETRRGATVVKVGFLIGVLFLAGGMFYFFANSLATINPPAVTPTIVPLPTTTLTALPTTTPTASQNPSATPKHSSSPTLIPSSPSSPLPSSTPSSMFSPSPTYSPSVSSTPIVTPTPLSSSIPTPTPIAQAISLSASYPPTAKMNSQVTMSFTIINPAGTTVHGVAIQTNVLFQDFAVQSSTSPVVGNVINVGDLPSGTTIVSLQLLSPSRPREITDTISLAYQGCLTR